jgi:type I restriction enzyme, S subunit
VKQNDIGQSSWKQTRLGELCNEITVGFVGSMTKQYVDHGVPFLRSKDVAPYRIDTSELVHVTEEFHNRIAKSRLAPGDVVIVRTGAPGTAARIPESLEEANCADLVVVRPNDELNATFLVYYVSVKTCPPTAALSAALL